MTPRVLFVGSGQGSWEVRGRQIGAALGACVTCRPTPLDWRRADVAILVKRAVGYAATAPRRAALIWDVLDSWRQPEENHRTTQEYAAEIQRLCVLFQIRHVIGATRQMGDDIGGVYLPHHARPWLELHPPRESARIVAYEGTRKYLGSWLKALEAVCHARQMRFVVNPPSIADADVVVAFRDGQWDGPLCRQWKSGVKYVNALVAGKPVITQPCAGVDEIAPVACRVDRIDQLGAALDEAIARRDEAYQLARARRQEYSIEAIAARYRALIAHTLEAAA